jgi:hypothetical protein
MSSHDLNRAVARATGEAVREIALRGFVLLTCGPVEHEPPDDRNDANEYGIGAGRRPEHAAPVPAF